MTTVPPVPMPDRDTLLAADRRAALRRAQRLNAGVRAAAMLAAAEAGLRG
ncbi:hypothetical protein GCM10027451_07490 [Geodermatophilus aquaeductus]|uniref:Uncharacterized protein n=1 Tax=Geodermatophilus aquaeductus TaxID=1564161 RepID=A0A521DDE5_9ACTN|nr:hypothetical protein [Geodermatophilus aquaeductus]SMO69747.1 hypothetical protein SAMN06273567_103105 [Geodermatophilus aquaeductus]